MLSALLLHPAARKRVVFFTQQFTIGCVEVVVSVADEDIVRYALVQTVHIGEAHTESAAFKLSVEFDNTGLRGFDADTLCPTTPARSWMFSVGLRFA